MPTFRYRAATTAGVIRTGVLEAPTREEVVDKVRRLGLMPIEAAEAAAAPAAGQARSTAATRRAAINAMAELAVLLDAGLPLDRALTISVQNIPQAAVRAAFERMLGKVKEGAPLSRALDEAPGLFPPMAAAMAEAGEADGRLGAALGRLADSLERADALRQTVVSSLVYPGVLLTVTSAVILLMMLVVVPQFEGLFSGEHARLPFMTQVVIAASEAVRRQGLIALVALAALVFLLRQQLRSPTARLAFDRWVLRLPLAGSLVGEAETAAFARTLGSLVEGGVPLPTALGIAQRAIGNSHMASAVARVRAGLKEGAGLSAPLAASGVFPVMAISFLRTGEETAQLGPMLGRLADVLDRKVRAALQRLIGIATPAITVFMAGIVATVIASIMSAILGFNDLALTP